MTKNAAIIELSLIWCLAFLTPAASAYEPPQNASWAEGVLLPSGEAGHTATDLTLRGRAGMDLTFTRTYRGKTLGAGPLGPGWDHNFRLRLRELATGTVELHDGAWKQANFEPTPDGTYTSPPGWFSILSKNSLGWLFRNTGGELFVFDRHGRWILWSDATKSTRGNGNLLALTYNSYSRLTKVQDGLGRALAFRYSDRGRLLELEDSTGRIVRYGYDELGRLTSVTSPVVLTGETTFPSGLVTRYSYTVPTGDLATRLRTAGQLISITDPAGVERWRVTYTDADGDGRALEVATVTTPSGTARFAYAGSTVTLTDRRGQTWITEHDPRGHPTRRVDPAGIAWRFAYDEEGLLTEALTPLGAHTLWTYAPASDDRRSRGNVLAIRQTPDFRGGEPRTWTYEYETEWNTVTRAVDPLGTVTTTEVGPGGRPLTITRAAGKPEAERETFTWDAFGQLIRHEDGEGRVTTYSYTPVGFPESVVVDPAGLKLTTRFETDARGNVTATTDPRGVRHTALWNELDWRFEATAAASGSTDGAGSLGLKTVFRHDALGRVVEVREPFGDGGGGATIARMVTYGLEGQTLATEAEIAPGGPVARTSFEYDAELALVRQTDPAGRVTEWQRDLRGLALAITRGAGTPEAATERFQYDAEATVVQQADGLNRWTTTIHDGFGRPIETISPLDISSGQSWDAADRMTSEWRQDDDGELVGTTTTYDALGRPVAFARLAPGGEVVERLTYDRSGRVVATSDALGRTTRYELDRASRLVASTDPAGNRVSWALDAAGNLLATRLTESSGTLGSLGSASYDALGRVRQQTDALGHETRFHYDARGNPRLTIDPEGQFTARTFDGLDRVTSLTRPEGIEIRLGYDAAGLPTSYRDALGHTTTWSYDALGRPVAVALPDGAVRIARYDAASQLVEAWDERGVVTLQFFDDAGRLVTRARTATTAVALPGPAAESFTWDRIDRLVRVDSGGVVTARSYDTLSRVTSETTGGQTVRYDYDAAGQPIGVDLPSGRSESRGWDALGRLTELSGTATFSYRGPDQRATSALGPLTLGYGYDGARRETLRSATTGSSELWRETRRRSERGTTTALAGADGAGRLFAHDGAGRVIATGTSADALALAGADAPLEAAVVRALPVGEAFTYDVAENLLSRESRKDGVTVTMALPVDPNRNRPASLGGQPLGWDAAGNLVAKGDLRFAYDGWNRLAEVKTAAGEPVATYGYDAFHRRISKTVAGVTETTVWSGWQPVEIYRDGQLTERRTYGAGLDELVLLERDLDGDGTLESRYRPVFDGAGNLALLTDEVGKPIERCDTSAYGRRKIFADIEPPAVEQLRIVAGELWLEISEAVSTSALTKAVAAGELTLTAAGDAVPLTASQPITDGDEARRRIVLRLAPAPAPGTELSLTIPPAALEDDFRNHAPSSFTQLFSWSATDTLIWDGAPPRIEGIFGGVGALEVELSEEPDPALAASVVTLDGQPLPWTVSADRYRLVASGPLAPGEHTLAVSTDPLDLAGNGLAEPFSLIFTLPAAPAVPRLTLFRRPDSREVAASTVGNRIGFHGREHDPETGFVYFRNRYLDPDLGRFITADPLGYADGPSEYAFAMNGPVEGRDPLGLRAATPEDRALLVELNRVRLDLELEYGAYGTYQGTPITAEQYGDSLQDLSRRMTSLVDAVMRAQPEDPIVLLRQFHGPGDSRGHLYYRAVPSYERWYAQAMADSRFLRGMAAVENVLAVISPAATRVGSLQIEPSTFARTAPPRTGFKSGVPGEDFAPNPAAGPYRRPTGAGPTAAQKRAVQGQPCVDCGLVTPKQVADHIDPLVVEHYRTGTIDTAKQSRIDAVQPHCPSCSSTQGGQLSAFARRMREILKKLRNE